jgi:hypothetical protein
MRSRLLNWLSWWQTTTPGSIRNEREKSGKKMEHEFDKGKWGRWERTIYMGHIYMAYMSNLSKI